MGLDTSAKTSNLGTKISNVRPCLARHDALIHRVSGGVLRRFSVWIAVYSKAVRVGDERDTLIEINKELKHVRKTTH